MLCIIVGAVGAGLALEAAEDGLLLGAWETLFSSEIVDLVDAAT